MINTFKWIVFLKVMDGKQLKTWEEFKMYEQIFNEHYSKFLLRNNLTY